MPRPCFCDEDSCRLCHLYHNNPKYRNYWGEDNSVLCIHRGGLTGKEHPCTSCNNRVQAKEYACSIHGACTARNLVRGISCCRICPDKVSTAYDKDQKKYRSLYYYMYPIDEVCLLWNLQQLKNRMELFDRAIFIISLDQRTLNKYRVEDLLGKMGISDDEHEFHYVSNHSDLREVKGLQFLLNPSYFLEKDLDPNALTFWAHAKGMTKWNDPTIRKWSEMLYAFNLDNIDLVEKQLEGSVFAGAFKKVGKGFYGSQSTWHYSGGFYWIRDVLLAKKNWSKYDVQWFGSESYPGCVTESSEGGCLFHEGSVSSMNMYDENYTEKLYQAFLEKKGQRNGVVVGKV